MTHQKLKTKLLETNYFEDNKYLDKYCELINNNLEAKKEKFKTQGHHILPRCYYNNIPYTKQERQEILQNIENSLTPKNAIPVQNLETGEVFKSSVEANITYNPNHKDTSNINFSCTGYEKGKNKISYGYYWIRLYNNREPYTPEEHQELLTKISQNS